MRIGEATRAPPMATLAGFRKSSNMGTDPGCAFCGCSSVQEGRQNDRERIAGPIELVIDTARSAAAPNLGQVFAQGREVAVAQRAGIAQQLRLGFHAFKAGRTRERKGQLVIVEDMKDQDIVTAV